MILVEIGYGHPTRPPVSGIIGDAMNRGLHNRTIFPPVVTLYKRKFPNISSGIRELHFMQRDALLIGYGFTGGEVVSLTEHSHSRDT